MKGVRGRRVKTIPRVWQNHKTPTGRIYSTYVRALLDRLGALPKAADIWLREGGLLVVRLHEDEADLERCLNPKARRVSQASRIRRRMAIARTQLARIEAKLEALAAEHRASQNPWDTR